MDGKTLFEKSRVWFFVFEHFCFEGLKFSVIGRSSCEIVFSGVIKLTNVIFDPACAQTKPKSNAFFVWWTRSRFLTQIIESSTRFIKPAKFFISSHTIVLLQLRSQYKGRISCNIAFY